MPTIGEQLRSAREQSRLTVHELANSLNMKADQVRAVEESRWSEFGAPVYIRGFVRTMAGHLKLDIQKVIGQLDDELKQTKDFAEAPSLVPRTKGSLDFVMLQLSRIRWTWVWPALLGIGIIAAVAFGLRRSAKAPEPKRPPQLGSGVYRGRKPAPNQVLPLPTNRPPTRSPSR